jgi:hypothetical protein
VTKDDAPSRILWLEGKSIKLLPALSQGLPANDGLLTGHGASSVWLAVGRGNGQKPTCEVFEFSGAWKSQGTTSEAEGACEHIAAWTPGSLVAVVTGPKGSALRVFGKAPAALPVLAVSPKNKCAIAPQHLSAWESGEATVVGVDCQASAIVLGYSGKKAPVAWAAPVDGNGPLGVFAPAKSTLVLYGGGILPSDPNTETGVRVDVTFDGTKFSQSGVRAAQRPDEIFLVGSAASVVTDDAAAFEYRDGAVLRDGERILVSGTLESGEAVLLSNRPVDAPLTL